MRIRITTETCLDEPDVDHGFISWLDIVVLDRDERDADVVVGSARAAVIHVGVAGSLLYDAMDADSGELEALFSIYFDEHDAWLKDEYAQGAGIDLLYVSEVDVAPAHRGKNVDLAVVRRLCDTIGTGSGLVVVACEDEDEAARWESMGFTESETGSRFMHMSQAFVQPRVVRDDDRDGAFRVEPVVTADVRRRMN